MVFHFLYLFYKYRITMVFHLVFTFNSKSPFPVVTTMYRCLLLCYLWFFTPQGSMVNLPEEENTPEKRVNKIFDIMDKVSLRKTYLHV